MVDFKQKKDDFKQTKDDSSNTPWARSFCPFRACGANSQNRACGANLQNLTNILTKNYDKER